MKVWILTEGGKNIGFGHISRCTAIFQALQERVVKPTFIINGDESVRKQFKGSISFDWLNDTEKLFSYIENADIVFVDSYLADYDLYEKISNIARMGVYFDDTVRIKYPTGFVLNGTISAEQMPYPKRNSVTYLLGTRYTPLRREFWDVPGKTIRDILETVMITFGGTDVCNLTPKVLKLLVDAYPQLNKKVVIGKGFQNASEIESIKDHNTELIYYPDAAEMKKVMLESDIAISSGGQTLYELARVGVPAIGICVADNQLQNIKGWQEVGFLKYICWYNNKDMKERLASSLKKLVYADIRVKMSQAGKTLVDGQGPSRIVSALGVV
ncbi:MAG: UDP-2,4-diacetamido-2,4,6-trideoxy-beta-L-altropyranose hydrolase [Phycisphaerae bacterium]|nr:UDP-2,4-diacetamido-2,4,6-trideoxy-beta-L-altropyranose hydrolase [Phycisphaerae bacterium]MDD5381683.1 UDP-2,4-diacetamido-2,4,6-trideoxy-beta-L-altropyranose hydrolase [Phycisphaerae bacterium]